MSTTTPPVVADALDSLQREQDVRVCVASEAGSRAWGYAGPESDHDVAVVFAQPPADYVVLDGYVASIHDAVGGSDGDRAVDVRAWNLTRFADLLTASNPSVLEALASPTCYRTCSGLDALREYALDAFSPIDCYHHYRSLATSQSETDGSLSVSRALVVVRAALYARYVRDTHDFPTPVFPAFLDDAGERFPDAWVETARRLVARKRAGEGDEPANSLDPAIVALPKAIDPDVHAVRGIERERVNDFVRLALDAVQQS